MTGRRDGKTPRIDLVASIERARRAIEEAGAALADLSEKVDASINQQRRAAAAKASRSRRAQGQETRDKVLRVFAQLLAMGSETHDAVEITATRCGITPRHVRRLARKANPPDESALCDALLPPPTRRNHGNEDH